MTLIEQLQQTPLWEKFEQWYLNNRDLLNFPHINYFNGLDFCFQKGVFEKFFESKELIVENTVISPLNIPEEFRKDLYEKKICQKWYLRSTYITKTEYYTICINDVKNPFNSFQELLIWYFNGKSNSI